MAALAGSPRLAAGAPASAGDTLKVRLVSRTEAQAGGTSRMSSVVLGYLSPRGLPPRPGQVFVSDTGLVFRSADGRLLEHYPLVGPVRLTEGQRWRAPTVSLVYVEGDPARPVYVFRLDAGVFATDAPGALLEVAERPEWLDSLLSREWAADRPLVDPVDSAAIERTMRRIGEGSYADTLYALFGRPARSFGQVGPRGRRAGRLGEYLVRRDSLALDPARMTSEDQLRHTLAHELAHRWQARSAAQLAVLWRGVPAIRDPRRYGHASATEHQAEAIAFAVHFLQTTAAAGPADPSALLAQYERLVPGTSLLTRYLLLQPIYSAHPLRRQLTT